MSVEESEVIIKKYANRRLYDMSSSKYVTLDYLCQMVKDGIEFKVIDAKTEEDLTRSVLTQIIFEQESKGYNLLPIGFLRQIIGFYDDNLGTVLPRYLDQSMQNFTENQDKMRSYLTTGVEDFSPMKQFEQFSKQQTEWLETTWKMFMPFDVKADDKKDEN